MDLILELHLKHTGFYSTICHLITQISKKKKKPIGKIVIRVLGM